MEQKAKGEVTWDWKLLWRTECKERKVKGLVWWNGSRILTISVEANIQNQVSVKWEGEDSKENQGVV